LFSQAQCNNKKILGFLRW